MNVFYPVWKNIVLQFFLFCFFTLKTFWIIIKKITNIPFLIIIIILFLKNLC